VGVRRVGHPSAERRAVGPLLILAPALGAAGAAFGYLVVLTPAVRFLQGSNHGASTMFEIPVLLLAVGRACVLSSATLRRHRGYAIVGLSVLGGAPARHRPGQRHGLGAWHSG
jgi:Sec-independent protein secretion pathway component TatC